MPKKKPAYLLHRPTGQARVRIDGHDTYLGQYGSPASRERYEDLITEWFAKQGDATNYVLEIDDLVLQFLDHAREHYRKDGRLTSEYHCLTPSQAARQSNAKPKRSPRERYTTASYRRAIERACEVAFHMPEDLQKPSKDARGKRRKETPAEKARRQELASVWRNDNAWNPHQLRHTRATVIRKKFGIEGAQVVLGHADCQVTEIYAERDFDLAARIMREIG